MRIQALQDKSEIPDIAYVKVMLKRLHLYGHTISRTKPADLQQICNRSVLPKTDKLQTNLLSA